MDASVSGSSVADSLGNAFRLTSDRNRQGQDAFTASPFSRLLITHVLSLAGDALVTLALAGSIFFSTSLHAARGRVALTLLVTIAPFAIVAPLLGPLIDRAGSRRLMVVATAVGRIVAVLLMARYINDFGLYPAALLSLVCSKCYTVTKATLVPAAVQTPRDLVEANSKLAVSGALGGFLIALPGVVILKLAGGAWVLRADVLVFLACAITALRLQTGRTAPASVAGRYASDTAQLVGQEAAEVAAHEVRAKPLPAGSIQVAAFTMGVLRFLVGFLTFLIAFSFRSTHAPAWWYGVVLTCSIGGNLIGAAIAPNLRARLREELILSASAVVVVAAGVLAFLFNSFNDRPAASLLAGVVGLTAGGAKLAFDALVQRHVPAANQGRAFGRFEAGFQLVWVFGGLVPVVIPLSLSAGIVITTVAAAVAATVFVVGFRMARLGQLPQWWPGIRQPRPRGGRPAGFGLAPAGAPAGGPGEAWDPGPAGAWDPGWGRGAGGAWDSGASGASGDPGWPGGPPSGGGFAAAPGPAGAAWSPAGGGWRSTARFEAGSPGGPGGYGSGSASDPRSGYGPPAGYGPDPGSARWNATPGGHADPGQGRGSHADRRYPPPPDQRDHRPAHDPPAGSRGVPDPRHGYPPEDHPGYAPTQWQGYPQSGSDLRGGTVPYGAAPGWPAPDVGNYRPATPASPVGRRGRPIPPPLSGAPPGGAPAGESPAGGSPPTQRMEDGAPTDDAEDGSEERPGG